MRYRKTLTATIAAVGVVAAIAPATATTPELKGSDKFAFYLSADKNQAMGIRLAGGRYKILTISFRNGYSDAFCFHGRKVSANRYRGVMDYYGSEAAGYLLPRSLKIVGGKHLGAKMTLQTGGRSESYKRVSEGTIERRGVQTGSSSVALKGRLYGKC